MPGTQGSQKMASDPLDLKKQAVVSGQVGAGSRARVLCRSSKCSNC